MSAAVSTGLALKCEVVCQGYLYAGIAGNGVWGRFSYYTLVLVKTVTLSLFGMTKFLKK